jgi:hypothetical protein
MRSDRFARRLLRLYPRSWRDRYGDELLALIEDSGLTWRKTANIVAVAIWERVRSAVGWPSSLSLAARIWSARTQGATAADS